MNLENNFLFITKARCSFTRYPRCERAASARSAYLERAASARSARLIKDASLCSFGSSVNCCFPARCFCNGYIIFIGIVRAQELHFSRYVRCRRNVGGCRRSWWFSMVLVAAFICRGCRRSRRDVGGHFRQNMYICCFVATCVFGFRRPCVSPFVCVPGPCRCLLVPCVLFQRMQLL